MILSEIIFFIAPVNTPAPIQYANNPEYFIYIVGGEILIELQFKLITHQEKNACYRDEYPDGIIH